MELQQEHEIWVMEVPKQSRRHPTRVTALQIVELNTHATSRCKCRDRAFARHGQVMIELTEISLYAFQYLPFPET